MMAGVKLAMDNYPAISAAETQRRLLIRGQLEWADRAKRRIQFRRRLFGGLKKLFIFLMLAATVAGLVNYRKEIKSVASKEIKQGVAFVQKRSQNDSLRQKALDYENQVDAVVATGR